MNRPSPVALIFGVVCINLIGFGIVIPVLPLYAERFGASPLTIGCLLGVYSLMQGLFAPVLGRLSDRVGRRPVLLLSMIGTSIGFFLTGIAQTLPLLFAARIIDGVTGANISTAQAYIADITPREHRSRRMGLIGAAFGLGFIFGPAIGGLFSRMSLSAPFYFAAGLSIANALAVFFFLPESLPAGSRKKADPDWLTKMHLQDPDRGMFLILVSGVYFLVTAGFSLLTATYPLFAERRFGYSASEIGFIFAAQGVIAALIQGGLLGWLLRLWRERGLVIAGTLLLAASFFVLPAARTPAALFLATAGVAIGHSLVAAPLNGLASKAAGPQSQGGIFGLMQALASLARIVGPVAGGLLLQLDVAHPARFGRTPYWVGAGVMAAAFLVAASSIRPEPDQAV